MLQLVCEEDCKPTNFFHVLRLSAVLRYFPSAIIEWRELVERACLLVDDNKPELLVDFYTEADLREGCVPVGW